MVPRQEEALHSDVSERQFSIVYIAVGPILQMRETPIPTCVFVLLTSPSVAF